ncbi:hypothetical protein FDB42_11840 [Clostridium botulinum]|nr:hypothetical protein [Clostridium botulinum]
MDITKFNEKFNRVDGKIYVVEEVVTPVGGLYEAELTHDNINNLNVYTGPKLTGIKITTYSTSTPSLTPWKTIIKIFSTISPLYISYETTGDTVEADDINNLQDAVNQTQKALNSEADRATGAEKVLTDNLNSEIKRAENKENELLGTIESETKRASATESKINTDLNTEINRAKKAESTENTRAINRENVIENNLTAEIKRSTDSENNIIKNLEAESNRAKKKEEELNSNINTTNNNLANEINRSTQAEKVLTDNLNKEIDRAKGSEHTLTTNINTTNANINNEIARATNAENDIKSSININKPNWDDAYNKRHIHSNKTILDGIGESITGDLTFKGGKIVSTTINGLADDIILEGGNNVTISKTGNKIVVSTAGGQEKIVTNTPISISKNDWILDNASGIYNITVQHNLNDTNIIIGVYNGTQKLELVGIMIKDTNSIILSNNEPIDCKVVINSSGQPTQVIDNLNSSDSNKALSAKQGKILKDLVNAVQGGVTIGKTLEDAKPISLFLKIID